MIYTVTVNPAIDEILAVEQLVVAGESTVFSTVRLPGGKGINVSRALKTLGDDSEALALIGDASLSFFTTVLAREQLSLKPFVYTGTTRISRTLVFQKDLFNTHLKERGNMEAQHVFDEMYAYLESVLVEGDILVMAGSVPDGLNPDVYQRLTELCRSKLALSFLDTSGLALDKALDARPFCLKLNLDEFADFAEESSEDVAEFKETALHLIKSGISYVIITMGIEGAVLYDGDSYYLARVDLGQASNMQVYPVGSGDAFTAGFLSAFSKGQDTAACLKHAVACGTANTMQPGSALFERAQVEQLEESIQVSIEKS